jgi:hypothetical protein
VRSRGPREALGAWLARAPDTLFSRGRLLFFARVTAGEPRHAARPGLELRRATPDDGARYEMCVGTDSARTFARRLTAETDCYIVVAGDDILHASWVTRGAAWTREVRRYVVPRPGDAYVYESFTVTGARGRGIYPFALTGICMSLSQRDTTMLWVAIEDRNLASLRAVTKAGFEVQTEVSYSRRMGVTTVRPPRPLGPRGSLAPALLRSPAGFAR